VANIYAKGEGEEKNWVRSSFAETSRSVCCYEKFCLDFGDRRNFGLRLKS